jgi:DNA-directed RNA polymerase II subunit RPB4
MDYGESTNPNAARPPPVDYPKPPRLVSRPKPPVAQEEEMGNEIKLGDFEDVHALSVSEARAVVTAVHKGRKNKDPESNPLRDRIHNDNPTITHFLDYFDNFARYKEEESLHAINAMFDTHPELTTVEKALLGRPCVLGGGGIRLTDCRYTHPRLGRRGHHPHPLAGRQDGHRLAAGHPGRAHQDACVWPCCYSPARRTDMYQRTACDERRSHSNEKRDTHNPTPRLCALHTTHLEHIDQDYEPQVRITTRAQADRKVRRPCPPRYKNIGSPGWKRHQQTDHLQSTCTSHGSILRASHSACCSFLLRAPSAQLTASIRES